MLQMEYEFPFNEDSIKCNLILSYKVLTEKEEVRKEHDDAGILSELEHWRKIRARIASLLGSMKRQVHKTAINILHISRSRVIRVLVNLILNLCVSCLGYDVKLHPVAGLKLGREWVLGNVELPLNCHYSQVHSDPEW